MYPPFACPCSTSILLVTGGSQCLLARFRSAKLLEGVAGCANSDDRPDGFPVGADRLHLVFGELHPAGEEQQEVGVFRRVEVLQGLTTVAAPGGCDGDAAVLFEVGEKRFQGGFGLVFLRAGDDVSSLYRTVHRAASAKRRKAGERSGKNLEFGFTAFKLSIGRLAGQVSFGDIN